MAQRSILVVGSLNMDLVVRVAAQPRPGETVLGSDAETFPGGKGGNQAVAAARAGGRVRLLGRVGQDAFGPQLLAAAQQSGVDTGLVAAVPGPSGLALITVSDDGQNMITVSPGANARLRPEDLSPASFAGVGLALMQLEIGLDTVVRAARLAKAQGARALLNAAPARALPAELLELLDVLIVNQSEAAFLAGLEGDPEAAARALHAQGVADVVLTLGSEGALWLGGAGQGRVAAHRVAVKDTTAAGDAFCGALAVRLAEGSSLAEAVAFANAAGALATRTRGAQPSLPTRTAIEALLSGA